jgi:hypothetical protein
MQNKPIKYHVPSERGQAIIIIVFAIIGLIGITALAVDGGLAFADRRQAQTAADSAVLAASLARLRGDDFEAAALHNAQENGYNNDGINSEIQTFSPPITGPYAGDMEYVQVIVTSHHKTYFAPVIGFDKITNTVEAVSRAIPPKREQILNGYAVISLAPMSDCKGLKSFWAHGESTLELYGGGVFINSEHPTCAFMQEGSASLVFADPTPFNIVGGASIQKIQLIKRIVRQSSTTGDPRLFPQAFLPTTGNSPIPYPPPFEMPKVGCGQNIAQVDSSDGTIMSPGFWDGDFPPEGVTKLKRGIYCIDGDVRVQTGEELEGQGVTLVVNKGSVRFSSGAIISLEAPSSGPFSGLLLYLPLENKSLVVLNGDKDSIVRGTILAPSSKIRILGNESSYGYHSQIIGFIIELDGNSHILVKYLDEQNYDAMIFSQIEFGQ